MPVNPLPDPSLALPRFRGRAADRKALVTMQRVLLERTLDPKTAPHIAAQCARAWRDLQECKRVIDGKPLPGQLRPDLAIEREEAAKRKRASAFRSGLLDQVEKLSAKESL
jgi:hypothetical protein